MSTGVYRSWPYAQLSQVPVRALPQPEGPVFSYPDRFQPMEYWRDKTLPPTLAPVKALPPTESFIYPDKFQPQEYWRDTSHPPLFKSPPTLWARLGRVTYIQLQAPAAPYRPPVPIGSAPYQREPQRAALLPTRFIPQAATPVLPTAIQSLYSRERGVMAEQYEQRVWAGPFFPPDPTYTYGGVQIALTSAHLREPLRSTFLNSLTLPQIQADVPPLRLQNWTRDDLRGRFDARYITTSADSLLPAPYQPSPSWGREPARTIFEQPTYPIASSDYVQPSFTPRVELYREPPRARYVSPTYVITTLDSNLVPYQSNAPWLRELPRARFAQPWLASVAPPDPAYFYDGVQIALTSAHMRELARATFKNPSSLSQSPDDVPASRLSNWIREDSRGRLVAVYVTTSADSLLPAPSLPFTWGRETQRATPKSQTYPLDSSDYIQPPWKPTVELYREPQRARYTSPTYVITTLDSNPIPWQSNAPWLRELPRARFIQPWFASVAPLDPAYFYEGVQIPFTTSHGREPDRARYKSPTYLIASPDSNLVPWQSNAPWIRELPRARFSIPWFASVAPPDPTYFYFGVQIALNVALLRELLRARYVSPAHILTSSDYFSPNLPSSSAWFREPVRGRFTPVAITISSDTLLPAPIVPTIARREEVRAKQSVPNYTPSADTLLPAPTLATIARRDDVRTAYKSAFVTQELGTPLAGSVNFTAAYQREMLSQRFQATKLTEVPSEFVFSVFVRSPRSEEGRVALLTTQYTPSSDSFFVPAQSLAALYIRQARDALTATVYVLSRSPDDVPPIEIPRAAYRRELWEKYPHVYFRIALRTRLQLNAEPRRTLLIGPEDRVLLIGSEDRLLSIGPEFRLLGIGTEDRLLTIGKEDRELNIAPEDRRLNENPG